MKPERRNSHEGPTPADIAGDMTKYQQGVFVKLSKSYCYRIVGGWKFPGGNKVNLESVAKFKRFDLIKEANHPNKGVVLRLTQKGLRVLAIIEGRAQP